MSIRVQSSPFNPCCIKNPFIAIFDKLRALAIAIFKKIADFFRGNQSSSVALVEKPVVHANAAASPSDADVLPETPPQMCQTPASPLPTLSPRTAAMQALASQASFSVTPLHVIKRPTPRGVLDFSAISESPAPRTNSLAIVNDPADSPIWQAAAAAFAATPAESSSSSRSEKTASSIISEDDIAEAEKENAYVFVARLLHSCLEKVAVDSPYERLSEVLEFEDDDEEDMNLASPRPTPARHDGIPDFRTTAAAAASSTPPVALRPTLPYTEIGFSQLKRMAAGDLIDLYQSCLQEAESLPADFLISNTTITPYDFGTDCIVRPLDPHIPYVMALYKEKQADLDDALEKTNNNWGDEGVRDIAGDLLCLAFVLSDLALKDIQRVEKAIAHHDILPKNLLKDTRTYISHGLHLVFARVYHQMRHGDSSAEYIAKFNLDKGDEEPSAQYIYRKLYNDYCLKLNSAWGEFGEFVLQDDGTSAFARMQIPPQLEIIMKARSALQTSWIA